MDTDSEGGRETGKELVHCNGMFERSTSLPTVMGKNMPQIKLQIKHIIANMVHISRHWPHHTFPHSGLTANW